MTNNPKVTIIIPAYNAEKFIHVCFESIEHLTYENIEVIFVDDGSKDNTFSMLQAFCKNHSYASCYTQENKGPSTARNVGLSHASGEYVCFFDSDDYVHPLFINVLIKEILDNQCDVVSCNFKCISEDIILNLNNLNQIHKYKKKAFLGEDTILSEFLSLKTFTSVPCNKLYKMSLLKTMASFPTVFNEQIYYSEDYEFLARYYSLCNKAIHCYLNLYFVRIRKGSITRSSFNEKLLSAFKLLEFFDTLDQDKFPISKTYKKAKECQISLEILEFIKKSNYNNKILIKEIYERYKNAIKPCMKVKKQLFWLKHFLYARALYFWFKFNKCLK